LKQSSSDEDIINLIAKDESSSLEFKSTMRKNIRSGKKDKSIEIAFLKGIVGFMNTDGGTLLIGVDDNGEIVGIEEDEFENNDKCRLHFKNLFRQHIGMEFSNYVEFFLKEIEGKTIAVVVCQRSKAAVFLKHENKETFYIRNGPSSEELAPSKVLSRMQGRG
jgi:predicted HTH transcriptional regulator